MVMLREILLLCLIVVCSARRSCRKYGGRCKRSLEDYPCSDPLGAVLTPRGRPLCRRNRYCCVAAPGILCFPDTIYGPKSFCMVPGEDPEMSPQTCNSPSGNTGPYGLHMEEGDHNCQTVDNKTRCCTVLNQCSTNPSGYCGPKYVLHNLGEICRNGFHDPVGDGACTDSNAPFCCLVTKQQCGTNATCRSSCDSSYRYPTGDVLCDESMRMECCLDEPRTTSTESSYSTTSLPTTKKLTTTTTISTTSSLASSPDLSTSGSTSLSIGSSSPGMPATTTISTTSSVSPSSGSASLTIGSSSPGLPATTTFIPLSPSISSNPHTTSTTSKTTTTPIWSSFISTSVSEEGGSDTVTDSFASSSYISTEQQTTTKASGSSYIVTEQPIATKPGSSSSPTSAS